jgi:hypothetical protein
VPDITAVIRSVSFDLGGNRKKIGSVLDADRSEITATVFRQKTGSVFVNTPCATIGVHMSRYYSSDNDASIDNIRFKLSTFMFVFDFTQNKFH